MQRVIAYVDGFNLYYGLRSKGWKWFYWLNIQTMARYYLHPNQVLTQTKYFTASVEYPDDRRQRQAVFLDALQTLPDFRIYYGYFLSDTAICKYCGHAYTAYHEKTTDVNIAVELLTDAFQDHFDVALLFSGDGDLAGLVTRVRSLFPRKSIVVIFPPRRVSKALQQAATAHTHVGRNVLTRSVFLDQVVKADGFVLQRPPEWR